MFWRIEVREKDGFYDAVGESVKKDIIDLGFRNSIKKVIFVYVYLLEGNINESEIKKICEDLLHIFAIVFRINRFKKCFEITNKHFIEFSIFM